jgi:hypothetical protein
MQDNRFDAYLDDKHVGIVDNNGTISRRGVELEQKEYTLTITHVHHDEEFESASTQIEIIDAGPDRDDDTADDGATDDGTTDGDDSDDDGAGFGFGSALLALGGTGYLLQCRLTANNSEMS